MLVLIVDDSQFMRRMLKGIIEPLGFTVTEAENGLDAIDKYQILKPDLVTMDITMPEMDGIEAVKAIKDIDPDANIVMISAMGQKSYVQEAIRYGAKDFVVKPFERERVYAAFEKIVGRLKGVACQ